MSKSISIFGEKWNVKFIKNLTVDGDRFSGYCIPTEKQIYIDSSQTKKEQEVTYIHEVFHAYCATMGIRNAQISIDLEEIIADQFAMLLTQLFDFEI